MTGRGAPLPVRDQIERRLRKVMVRSERLAVSADRNGMLAAVACSHLDLMPRELSDYVQRLIRS